MKKMILLILLIVPMMVSAQVIKKDIISLQINSIFVSEGEKVNGFISIDLDKKKVILHSDYRVKLPGDTEHESVFSIVKYTVENNTYYIDALDYEKHIIDIECKPTSCWICATEDDYSMFLRLVK